MIANYFIAIFISYLIGSIPNGLLLGKAIWHVDLRKYGSHNIGATNAWRTIDKTAGITIFVADLLKGVLSVYIASLLSPVPLAMILAGIFAIIGHSVSIFLGFKGGKGVATGLGVLIMLMPSVSAFVFVVWLIVVLISKYVSLGSIVAAALVPISAYVIGLQKEYVIFGIIAAIFVIYRHKANIIRLIHGKENKIKAGHRS